MYYGTVYVIVYNDALWLLICKRPMQVLVWYQVKI